MRRPTPQETSDAFASLRHEQRLELARLARLGLQFEQAESARLVAKQKHLCDKELCLSLQKTADAFKFRCNCGAIIEVTGMEASTL